jgi:hypothetical protein
MPNTCIAKESADPDVITVSDDDDVDDDDDEESQMTEFVELDIEHLKFKLFSVPRHLAVRIFSVNIQFYKWQEMVRMPGATVLIINFGD